MDKGLLLQRCLCQHLPSLQIQKHHNLRAAFQNPASFSQGFTGRRRNVTLKPPLTPYGRTPPSFCGFTLGADPHRNTKRSSLVPQSHLDTNSLHQKVAVYTLPHGAEEPAPFRPLGVNHPKVGGDDKGVTKVTRA